MIKITEVCTSGECGGDCYKCRCRRLVEQNQQLQDELGAIRGDLAAAWPAINRRRAALIDLEEQSRLSPAEGEELEALQRLADVRISLLQPVQLEGADRIIEDLKRRGWWNHTESIED